LPPSRSTPHRLPSTSSPARVRPGGDTSAERNVRSSSRSSRRGWVSRPLASIVTRCVRISPVHVRGIYIQAA
ncbi:unnamed protein product, partial [Ectocarpus sp. 12 AP-2014]